MSIHRILSIYTAAVVASIILFLLSPILLVRYGEQVIKAALTYLIFGVFTVFFIYDYMRYAVREWAEFTPQGAALATFFVLSYTIMYMSLMSLSMFGAGGINLAVWTSAMVSAAMLIYVLRNVPLHLTSGNPMLDIAAGTKLLPLALVVGAPFGWLFVAVYESIRIMYRGAVIAGASVLVSIALFFIMFGRGILEVTASDFAISVFAPFLLYLTGLEVLVWPGIIAWEELTTRFLLPAVGPLANYMFVVLHAPSRYVYVPMFVLLVLAIVSIGARWLTDLYKRYGLIGAISGHAVYNGMLGWLFGLVYFPWLTIATLIVLTLAYIYVTTSVKT